ncbi:hypothetical protein BGZ58_010249 [Dissophora ornata]|nr:hypothetical protein BGZ58_010249 [Dissophora ornata]
MSAKLGSTAPSPSIANLANKVINRLANNNSSNINNNNNNNNNNNSNNNSNVNINHSANSNNNAINSNNSIADEDEDSGENEEDDEDAGIIRCICNFTDDDGFTIQCERCLVWQHAVCVGIVQSNVPDKYLCELCSPRPVDRKRANEIQRRRNGTLERKREKSPSRRKSSVGRPRKQFGSTSGGLSEQSAASSSAPSLPKENGTHQNTAAIGASNGYQSKASSNPVDMNVKKIKSGGGNKQAPQHSNSNTGTPSTHQHHSSSKHKSAGPSTNSRVSSVTNEDDDLDMDSDSQEDAQDAYQFEFSPIETNIVTSKAVQELFRQVITQFRQAQSRKRSLSLTSGVKLHELVASNSTAGSNTSTPSIPESPDLSPSTLGSQPPAIQPLPNADPSNVASMERESLAKPLMKTTVKHILSSSRSSHSPVPQYGLFAESNIGAGRFMLEFKGEVSLKSAYKADPINQYSILATPKPFVLFHPQLNLVVDARRSGNDARFVRRSCAPNTEVKSIVVPGVQDQTVHLGLFAKVPIGKGQEITLDWNWNRDHPALQSTKVSMEKAKDSFAKKGLKEIRKAKHLVASTLLAQTDCACENKETCVLHQMLKDGVSESGAREHDSSTVTKGSRPKKTTSESLRQRYGGQRERSEGKRSADQETSDEELSVAESSPRRKSPKAVKLDGPSKKARHESHSHLRSVRTEQDMDSDSESDDHRRRKQATSERPGSPSKRSNQEMSAREMKQALMLIKKMEDRDASSTGHSKQKSLDISSKDPSSLQQKRAGLSSPTPRPRDKGRTTDVDQKSMSPNKKTSAEDDDVSIGDSGIDSDSNNGALRRDPFSLDRAVPSGNKRLQTIQSQGKRDREQMEHDTLSQSSATSDSDRKDPADRLSKRPPTQSGKKQPYAAASRGKRMAEKSSVQSASKARSVSRGIDTLDDAQNLSGSSSVEGSFVSIVGNTSDEDEETNHKADRKILREKNLPKETLPTASLKPSVLPCKKVWKMIYLKQRAVAEEEAREKAEEMRKKAEEVFDLKMEEDESNITPSEPVKRTDVPTFASPSPKTRTVDECNDPSVPSEPLENTVETAEIQPSMVEGDVLNLFHEDVKPKASSSATGKDQAEMPDDKSMDTTALPQPTHLQQPIVAPPTVPQEPPVAMAGPTAVERPRTPQKLSIESYLARRLASSSPALSEEQNCTSTAMITTSSITPNASKELMDIEMTEPGPDTDILASAPQALEDAATLVNQSDGVKAEAAPAIPKVKLSLQEYQKQRQGASQRNVYTPGTEVPKQLKTESKNEDANMDFEGSNIGPVLGKTDSEPVDKDVEMSDGQHGQPDDAASEQDQKPRDDYFQVGASLPTPLIGLSSRAQATSQSSGDYFPVQPFSPISLSAGPTPFSKLNLTSSPPRNTPPIDAQAVATGDPTAGAKSPVRSHVGPRALFGSSPKEPQGVNTDLRSPGNKLGSSPPPSQGSAGWRTPRSQRGQSPPPPASGGSGGSYRGGGNVSSSDHRALDSRPADGRTASPRYYGSSSERPERPSLGSLNSPTRERQQSLTSGGLPTSPYDGYPSSGSHFGHYDDSSSFKRSGHLSSPTGPSIPSGPRDYYKSEDRIRHRSVNGDEWGYGNMEPSAHSGYRGPRGGPLPHPRDRDRERDRERDHERKQERDRRDRFDRRVDYFASGSPGSGSGVGGPGGNSAGGFYGFNRGPGGPGGPGGMGGMGGGGYGRRPSDYYGNQGREDGYSQNGPSSSNVNNIHGKKDGPSDNPPASF